MEDGNHHDRVLEGTVGVVTGAGQGMGRGIALALAVEGAQVALVGRTRSKLEAVAAEVRARGSEASVYEVDVTGRSAVFALAADVLAAHGRVDIVVNAAYDTRVGRFDELTATDARHDHLRSVRLHQDGDPQPLLHRRRGSSGRRRTRRRLRRSSRRSPPATSATPRPTSRRNTRLG